MRMRRVRLGKRGTSRSRRGHPLWIRLPPGVVRLRARNVPEPGSIVISYAQNFEDVMLNRVFADQTTGFYIDVGAMDPVLDSVTKTFYDRGWTGINIEPDARSFASVAAARERDINLNVAVGDKPEVRSFYNFDTEGISTFHEMSRDSFVERGYAQRGSLPG